MKKEYPHTFKWQYKLFRLTIMHYVRFENRDFVPRDFSGIFSTAADLYDLQFSSARRQHSITKSLTTCRFYHEETR